MLGGGDLRDLVAFDRPTEADDDYGGVATTWGEAFARPAHFRYLRGGETVQARRLEGRQPVVVTVFADPDTLVVTTDWRMRDTLRAETYNIRSIVLSEDRHWLELTCEKGVAA